MGGEEEEVGKTEWKAVKMWRGGVGGGRGEVGGGVGWEWQVGGCEMEGRGGVRAERV